MIITYADVKACAFCSRGMREWFKQNNLDYLHFVGNGIDSEVLLATQDPFAIRAVEQAEKRLKGIADGAV